MHVTCIQCVCVCGCGFICTYGAFIILGIVTSRHKQRHTHTHTHTLPLLHVCDYDDLGVDSVPLRLWEPWPVRHAATSGASFQNLPDPGQEEGHVHVDLRVAVAVAARSRVSHYAIQL